MAHADEAACLSCGGPASFAFLTRKQPVFRCQSRRCGLAFDHPQPTDAALDAAYAEDYERPDPLGCTPSASTESLLDGFEATYGPLAGRHALDFGAGVGTVSEHLIARSATVAAVESAARGRADISSRLGIPVAASLDELDDGGTPYDVVVMIEVIEHLRDPRAVLESIHGRMRAGGILLLTTPNLRSLQARLRGPRWSMIDSLPHIVYFDARSLTAILHASGFVDVVPLRGLAPPADRPFARRAVQRLIGPLGLGGGLQVTARRAGHAPATDAGQADAAMRSRCK